MKKFVICFVFGLLLIGCNNNTDIDPDPIRRVHISDVLEKRHIILITKIEDGTGIVPKRTAYIRDLSGDTIYYIPDIPLKIWNVYFKDIKEGDTIHFY